MNRIEPLDWHRGLLAISIMLYHLISWEIGPQDSSTLLGRMGIYGVSMFFVLSGLSMAFVYSTYIKGIQSAANFIIRRIFRILPLMFLAVAFVSLKGFVTGRPYDWFVIVMNITTAFGFFSPHSFINTGAWSIGNEMVYYALTPFIIFSYNKNIIYGNLILLGSVLIGIYFAFFLITEANGLKVQWPVYVNPFNNFFFYCAGMAIYYNFTSIVFSHRAVMFSLAFSILIFAFYPAQLDKVNIVTGINRVVFSLASILMVFSFYRITWQPDGFLSRALATMGVITFGVYLLHPIIHEVTMGIYKMLGLECAASVKVMSTIVLTFIVARMSYQYIELPFIRLGKRLTLSGQ